MKRQIISLLLTTLFISCTISLNAQVVADTSAPLKRTRVAIFAPLFLDSAFSPSGSYKLGGGFARFLMPGLEFYEGARMALDTLGKEGIPLEVFIYDTRSTTRPLQSIISSEEMKDIALMIGSTNLPETKLLAAAALRKKIPFISATLPSDGATVNNPYFVVLNSTLRTHCEGIYKYIQKNYSSSPVVVFRQKGENDMGIRGYLQEMGKTTSSIPLKVKFVELGTNFSPDTLTSFLDSSRTICIGASLDDNFSRKLAAALAGHNKELPGILFGMPTWDDISFKKPEFKGLEIFYTTPYYNPRTDKISQTIGANYKNLFRARPSDMVFKGYEATHRFIKLITEYKTEAASNLGVKKFKVFHDFDIQPVMHKDTLSLDYFENRKLYFVKTLNGTLMVY